MLKTYLYLPEELDKKINKIAKARKKSKAGVIREAIHEGLTVMDAKSGGADVMLKLAELGSKLNAHGPKDLSKNLDKYLWEDNEDGEK